jgi:hypothetical protein
VLNVALDAGLVPECHVQPAGVKHRVVAREALAIGDALTGLVALWTAVGVVVCGVTFVQGPRSHTKEALCKSERRKHQTHEYQVPDP